MKESLNKSDWSSEAEGFYSVLRGSVRNELDSIESSIGATVEPPNVCVFAPVEYAERSLIRQFDTIDSVSEAEILAGMSIFLGRVSRSAGGGFDDLVGEEIGDMCFYFMGEYEDHKLVKIARYFNILSKSDQKAYHEYAGRFFPEENYFALNCFHEENLPDDLPEFLVPVRNFLKVDSSDNVRKVVVHEMTHTYIENKSKFKKRTSDIYDLDEAAAQAVDNVFDGNSTPSSKYYKEHINQDVMQAARQVFLKSIGGKDVPEAVSLIRRKAVKAIDKVVEGEDPVKALRKESNHRSRIVRIASYATKRMADDVIRDLAIVGITKPYTKFADVKQSRNRSKELTQIWGDLEEINSIGEHLHTTAYEGSIKQDLREPTEELSENARKIYSLIRKDYEDNIDGDISFIDDIFGESAWTDPAVHSEDELVNYVDGVLYRYGNLVEEAVSRAEKLELATEKVHEEGETLVEKYNNKEASETVRKLIGETEKLHGEIDEVRQNLEDAEEMVKIGLEKIDELKED